MLCTWKLSQLPSSVDSAVAERNTCPASSLGESQSVSALRIRGGRPRITAIWQSRRYNAHHMRECRSRWPSGMSSGGGRCSPSVCATLTVWPMNACAVFNNDAFSRKITQ